MLLGDGCGVLAEDAELGPRLIEVLGDESLRKSLTARGYERAAEYSWERMTKRHEEAYEEAIARWSSGRRGDLSG
jgi:glycosyltransferase involved in cell wall biosynthesis